jgi:hypothetical protein
VVHDQPLPDELGRVQPAYRQASPGL